MSITEAAWPDFIATMLNSARAMPEEDGATKAADPTRQLAQRLVGVVGYLRNVVSHDNPVLGEEFDRALSTWVVEHVARDLYRAARAQTPFAR